jgi:prepilin-type N-terminal cleavage/methylation domain-containing protein
MSQSLAHRRAVRPRALPRVSQLIRARAFTLVEMLIAMALTLILVYAIAHFYAIVGDAVKDGRSMIEMNQTLRSAVERLKSDLDQVTVPVTPWADEGGAAGYFEICEGRLVVNPSSGLLLDIPASDWDVNGNYKLDAEYDSVDSTFDLDSNGVNDFKEPNVTDLLGDTDDVIAMTIRAGGVPFTGQSVQTFTSGVNDGLLVSRNATLQGSPPGKFSNPPLVQQISAPYAEVVWWTSFSDTNGDGKWQLNEPRILHRRQLLIRPDLNVLHAGSTIPYFVKIPHPPQNQAGMANQDRIYLYDLFQFCDVSLRPIGSDPTFVYFAANSLADLCRRENRFMHQWTTNGTFPYALDLNPQYAGSLKPNLNPGNVQDLQQTFSRHPNPFDSVNPDANGFAQYRWVLFDDGRKGEDVMLSNLLAFDVRVFDPDARVRTDSPTVAASTTALQPGDPGYARANANEYLNTHAPYVILGTGAYVDLGYGYGLANVLPTLGNPHTVTTGGGANFNVLGINLFGYVTGTGTLGSSRFAGLASVPSSYTPLPNSAPPALARLNYRNILGLTWDSWTMAYERDGVNQDLPIEVALTLPQIIDEGTDGIDNDGINGVDDVGERETAPPYPHALRGVQIKIRIYEPGTRQMRQATVESDFISE